jgi:molybdate transport system regulatory protein
MSSNGTLSLNYKFWIETDNGDSILGEGKWKLLKAIRRTGSLQAAINEMGYTYRQTWENLKRIEEKLGFKLIEKTRGGEKGGQTVLTAKGERFIDFFDKLYDQIEPDIQKLFAEMLSELKELTE